MSARVSPRLGSTVTSSVGVPSAVRRCAQSGSLPPIWSFMLALARVSSDGFELSPKCGAGASGLTRDL
jgi:hypothetical protein